MPIYLFQNKNTGEIKEFLVPMKEIGSFFPGKEWQRVYTAPNVSVDSNINPYSSKDFVEKTRNKKETIGDLFDRSKELSEKRGGISSDPVLKNYFKSYEKEKGVKHANQIALEKKEKIKEIAKSKKISIG